MNKIDLIKIAKKFRERINKEFGKKCSDYNFGCVVCNAYKVVDDLEELANLLEAIDENKKHNHKK